MIQESDTVRRNRALVVGVVNLLSNEAHQKRERRERIKRQAFAAMWAAFWFLFGACTAMAWNLL